jgi:hypothetical protein
MDPLPLSGDEMKSAEPEHDSPAPDELVLQQLGTAVSSGRALRGPVGLTRPPNTVAFRPGHDAGPADRTVLTGLPSRPKNVALAARLAGRVRASPVAAANSSKHMILL